MYKVVLSGGSPWGFRLEDGTSSPGVTGRRVQIAKLNTNSKAHVQGVQIGDIVHSVNSQLVTGLTSAEVMQVVRGTGDTLSLELFRGSHHSSDIYSSGFSSKDSNCNISISSLSNISTLSGHSGSLSSLTLCPSPNEEYEQNWTHGQKAIKSYRPVLFDVTRGADQSDESRDEQNSDAAKSSYSNSGSGNNFRSQQNAENTRHSETSRFSVELRNSENELNRRNSSANNPDQSSGSNRPHSNKSVVAPSFSSSVPSISTSVKDPRSNLSPSGSVSDSMSRLPTVQNPTITLLKKKRADGQSLTSTDDDPPREENFPWRQARTSDSEIVSESQNIYDKNPDGYSSRKITVVEKNKFNLNGATKIDDKNVHSRSVEFDSSKNSKSTEIEPSKNRSMDFESSKNNHGTSENRLVGSTTWQDNNRNGVKDSTENLPRSTDSNVRHGSVRVARSVSDDVSSEKKLVKFEGIGPIDERTGVPVATRSSLDPKNQKDWYRYMYKSMHQSDQNSESSYVFPGADESFDKDRAQRKSIHETTYTIRKATPEEKVEKYASTPSLANAGVEDKVAPSVTASIKDISKLHDSSTGNNSVKTTVSHSGASKTNGLSGSLTLGTSLRSGTSTASFPKFEQSSTPSSPRRNSTQAWTLAQYKYDNQPYKVQPRRIEDYEPGQSSALLGNSKQSSTSIGNLHADTESPSSRLIKRSESRDESEVHLQSRPFWKSMSSLDQNSTDRETIRLNVGSSHQKLQTPAAFKTSEPTERTASNGSEKHNNTLWQAQSESKGVSLSHDASRNYTSRGLQDSAPKQISQLSFKPQEPTANHSTNGSRTGSGGNGHPISCAKALYTFRAQSPTDLSITEGDTVYILDKIDDNWYEGEANGKVGKFPIMFVKIEDASTDDHDDDSQDARNFGRGRALYDFDAQTALELSFKKNEEMTLISRVNQDWFEARIGDRSGFVPSNFIHILKEPKSATSPKKVLSPHSPEISKPLHASTSTWSTSGFSPPQSVPHNFNRQPSQELTRTSFVSSQSSVNKTSGYQRNPSTGVVSQSNRSSIEIRDHKSPQENTAIRNQQFASNGLSNSGRNFAGSHDSRLGSVNNNLRKPEYSTNGFGKGHSSYSSVGQLRSSLSNVAPSAIGVQERNVGVGKSFHSASTSTASTKISPEHSVNSFHAANAKNFGKSKYLAVYSYNPRRADELELYKGDVVYIMEKYDDGWCVGMSERTKKMGTFPGNYVQAL